MMRPRRRRGFDDFERGGQNSSSCCLRLSLTNRVAISFPSPSRSVAPPSGGIGPPRLKPMELGVSAAEPHQIFVCSVFDQAAAIDRDDAVGTAHCGQPMRDYEHRSSGSDAPA